MTAESRIGVGFHVECVSADLSQDFATQLPRNPSDRDARDRMETLQSK
jgi:hypothetical protein